MAEFLTMQEAEDKFGKKGRTNAALTLGIIGTALGAFTGNNGCGCGNNGILGGLFGGNNGNCIAEKAMQTAAALPLMFELNKVNAERYSDNCCCKSEKQLLVAAGDLQRQLDHKITGQLKYAYSDLCAPVPSISPLYCSPFTQYGTGMYAGQAASNWNAVNTAINSACPSCTAQ